MAHKKRRSNFGYLAAEMGRIVEREDLLGYAYKGRKFRRTQDLRRADFVAVLGLANGFESP